MNYKELWDELRAVIKDQQAFNTRQLPKAKDEKEMHLREGEIFEDKWILYVMEDLEAKAKREEEPWRDYSRIPGSDPFEEDEK